MIRMMLVVCLLLVICSAAGAQFNPEPLYEYAADYTVWSDVSDGTYWWAVRNERTDATMLGWYTGAGWPIGTIPGAAIVPEAVFPLPVVEPTKPRPWFNAFLNNGLAPLTVMSTMYWEDGTSASVPVYMPSDAPTAALIPEPSGLLALLVGFGGVIGCRRRRS